MRALLRVVAITLGGAVLYDAGLVNSQVIYQPDDVGAILVTGATAASIVMLLLALRGDGRDDARTPVDGRLVGLHRDRSRAEAPIRRYDVNADAFRRAIEAGD